MIGPTSPQTDYLDAQVAVVASVTWAGRTWRLSDRELSGVGMAADPGLLEAPDVSAEISLSPGVCAAGRGRDAHGRARV